MSRRLSRNVRICGWLAVLASGLLAAISPAPSFAGGGPENVFLVVNPRSWASLTVANHYCHWRRIPAGNVFYLDWPGPVDEVEVEVFRRRILTPIFDEITKRGLTQHIDYVVYAPDFPYAVNVAADLPGGQHTVASITSLTYLAPLVANRRKEYSGLNVNWYYRPTQGGMQLAPTRGFRSGYIWGPLGERVENQGQRYMLSTMLAYTSGRGNSVTEALDYLRRSVLADGLHPRGTIYYVKNSDVRSTTREPAFAAAVAELQRMGVAATVVDGQLPSGKRDVQGAMLGVAAFNWQSSQSRILPGAICEHLTSFGGILREGGGQTPLSELLRHGAAGSSGTVVEPFAIQAKFPHPMIHVHYARGCSLAEAFYQSVHGPYQLLVVGDPLCRPWANIPLVEVAGVQPGETVSGDLTITPSARTAPGVAIARFQLYVDGRLADEIDPGANFLLNTRQLGDGYHELRVVAIDDSPIESQGRLILPIRVNNHGRTIEWAAAESAAPSWDAGLRIAVRSPNSQSIAFYRQRHPLGVLPGEEGVLGVQTDGLGLGPVELLAVGVGASPTQHVFAPPLRVVISPGPFLPAGSGEGGSLLDGLRLDRADGTSTTVTDTRDPAWAQRAGAKLGETFHLSGYFQVPRDDVYQFQAELSGSLQIEIGGIVILEHSGGPRQMRYAPVALERGWHRVDFKIRLEGDPHLRLYFGGPGATSLDGDRFKRRP